MTTDTTKAAMASAISHVLKSYGFKSAMCADELAALLRANAAVVPDLHDAIMNIRAMDNSEIARAHEHSNQVYAYKCGHRDARHAAAELVAAAPSAPVLAEPADQTTQAAQQANPWCPDVCPLTGLRFFMWIEHHKTGQMVPTYGGPYDSYTIPVRDDDGSFCRERYDHDRGGWLVDEVQDVGIQIVSDQAYVSDEPPAPQQPVQGGGDAVRPGPTNVMRIDLITQVHNLISKLELCAGLLAPRDPDMARSILGDIAHARKETEPYNYNGPYQEVAPQAQGVVAKRCPYKHPEGTTCPACHDWDTTPPSPVAQPEALPVQGDGDLVLVERSLLGAACSAIDKKRDAPNTLAKLRALHLAAYASLPTSGVPVACKTCSDSRVVYDGEINSEGGVSFSEGSIRCVKDCPDCAAPQPAAARVGLSRQYRLLQSGIDKIEENDEFLSEDTQAWAPDPNGIFVGMVYGGRVLRPARRAIEAAHGIASPQEDGGTAA